MWSRRDDDAATALGRMFPASVRVPRASAGAANRLAAVSGSDVVVAAVGCQLAVVSLMSEEPQPFMLILGAEPLDAKMNCAGDLLAVAMPDCSLKLYSIDTDNRSISLLLDIRTFTDELPLSRVSVLWHPMLPDVVAITSSKIATIFKLDMSQKRVETIRSQKYEKLRLGVWSLDGANLYLFENSKVHCIPYDQVEGVKSMPFHGAGSVRSAVFLDRKTIAVSFDMDESNIFSQYDILGSRGWDESPADAIRASDSRELPPFSLNLAIPDVLVRTREAQSTVRLFSIDSSMIELKVLSETTLPILMPDILIYNKLTKSLAVANKTVGAIFMFELHEMNALPKTFEQVIRLDGRESLLGASFVTPAPDNLSTESIMLLTASPVLSDPVVGIATTSTRAVSVKTVKYSRKVQFVAAPHPTKHAVVEEYGFVKGVGHGEEGRDGEFQEAVLTRLARIEARQDELADLLREVISRLQA
ncbi:hypothetical protein HDU82_006856 [Entophlyctis luteolus]|nr:hypothetical protein HDU82_006856 [Entophlyctis luteolus]